MSIRDELEAFTGEYPPTWYPRPGAIICGQLLRYDRAGTAFGNSLVCVIDDDQEGPCTVWLNATVLLDQFKRYKPKVGETVGIKCLGKHPEKGYWRFVVRVDRGQPELDLDTVQAVDAHLVDEELEDPFEDPFEDQPNLAFAARERVRDILTNER